MDDNNEGKPQLLWGFLLKECGRNKESCNHVPPFCLMSLFSKRGYQINTNICAYIHLNYKNFERPTRRPSSFWHSFFNKPGTSLQLVEV